MCSGSNIYRSAFAVSSGPEREHAALNLSHFPNLRTDLHRYAVHGNLAVSCGVASVINDGNVLKYLPGSGLAGAPGCTDALSWVLF